MVQQFPEVIFRIRKMTVSWTVVLRIGINWDKDHENCADRKRVEAHRAKVGHSDLVIRASECLSGCCCQRSVETVRFVMSVYYKYAHVAMTL